MKNRARGLGMKMRFWMEKPVTSANLRRGLKGWEMRGRTFWNSQDWERMNRDGLRVKREFAEAMIERTTEVA